VSSWIAYHRSDEAEELQARHPNAFLLLAQIARRARWKDCPIKKLKAGQALVGDWKKAGIPSEMAYRIAKDVLSDCGLATFKGTTKGTIATLCSSSIFSLSELENNGQGNEQATDEERTNNGRATTNVQGYKEKGVQGHNEEFSLQAVESSKSKKTKKSKKAPFPNTPLMIRIGKFFNRRETTKWDIEEFEALQDIDPSPEDVATIEEFYLAVIDKDDDHRRTSLMTLLNNWNRELDKANSWEASQKPTQKQFRL
jgi:Tfp pilus assembly protein PilW